MVADKIENRAQTKRGTLASLRRNRDFVLLWCGQTLSGVGSRISLLAFPMLMLAITGSPAETGLLSALANLPGTILPLPAGVLADRCDRKRLMIISDTVRGLALASIPTALLLGHLTLVQLVLAALAEATFANIYAAAASSCLPLVVCPDDVPVAVGLGSVSDSATRLVGPSLAGLFYTASRALPFLADAVSYAVSVISLLCIKADFQGDRRAAPAGLWREMREGLGWLWRHAQLRFLALLIGGLNVCSFGYPLILIVRARELHADAMLIGLLFCAGGIGGMIGALLAAPLRRRFTMGQIMIGGTWAWVITWFPFALAPNLPMLFLADVIGWLPVTIFWVTQYSYRLQLIPEDLLGRVNSVFQLITVGCEPVALAIAGALLQAMGGTATILILIVPQAVLAVVATLRGGFRVRRRALSRV